jgi:hypothetical protein
VRCEELGDLLAASPDGIELDDRRARRHVEGCLRCQAELVRYRKLLRALRALRTEVIRPSPGLVADVLASLEEAGEREAVRGVLHGRRVAYVSGLAVAAAAAAAGASVIVRASRGRGRRVRLAG